LKNTGNGQSYTASPGDYANGKVTFKKLAPYVGIGWGDASMEQGFHFTADLGVMYMGAASPSLQIHTANTALQS